MRSNRYNLFKPLQKYRGFFVYVEYFLYIVDVKDSKIKFWGYWTKENCKEESLKYKNRFEFKKVSGGAYHSSRKNGWLDEFFPKTKRGQVNQYISHQEGLG